MVYITSKTHRYISVRQFPSDSVLKGFHEHKPKAIKAFHEFARSYHDFYQAFIEFATGNKYKDYQTEYMFGHRDATKEELHELTGIKIACSGNNEVYCIPRTPENEKIFDYIIENVPSKYKILKKTRGTYMDHGPSTFYRDGSRTPDHVKELLRKERNKLKT